jgi:hypothetical protein
MEPPTTQRDPSWRFKILVEWFDPAGTWSIDTATPGAQREIEKATQR